MLKLSQFRIAGTVPSADTTTYRAVDKATGLEVMLHFLPPDEGARYQLSAQLERYIETCRSRRSVVTLVIDEGEEFIVSQPIGAFRGLGAWLEQEIAATLAADAVPAAAHGGVPEWLPVGTTREQPAAGSATEFGFRPIPNFRDTQAEEVLPAVEAEPEPAAVPVAMLREAAETAPEEEKLRLRAERDRYRRLVWALSALLAAAVLALVAVMGGSSR